MKKKNLIILLIFPFLIATFCIVTVNTTYNRIDVDISYIDWKYQDMEAFQVSESLYPLEAVGVNQRYYGVSGGNQLTWTVRNKNGGDGADLAEIVESNGRAYLRAKQPGEVIITCSSKTGTVSRQMTGVLYENAALLFYPTVGSSQANIDSTVYYGEYDHRVGEPAFIDMTMLAVPTSEADAVVFTCSENLRYDKENNRIEILGTGEAYVTAALPSGLAMPTTFRFEVVDEGVNVYTYDDLLYCTNQSEQGEIAVLRKSFESLYNAYVTNEAGKPVKVAGKYQTKTNNVECFGNYDASTGKFSFAEEIYSFATTYNNNFIEQWNTFTETNPLYKPISDRVWAGLHVQKDFYGNGYTLNLHNLTYPYSYVLMSTESGENVRIPQLTPDNLFRGPLRLYALGDPGNMPFVSLYGQDNVGMYVEGDGIVINDVNLKNCEFGDRLANLATVGTVMETDGTGITVKNCRLSNGKSVMRSFSSMDLTVSNCMLSYSQTFLFVTGANEYVAVDGQATADFSALDGSVKTEAIESFLSPGGEGDQYINDFLVKFCSTSQERDRMRNCLTSIQNALGQTKSVEGNFKGSTEIKDCFFYQSGISSICMETLFNSAYLEYASPSMINELFSMFESEGKSIVPYTPTHVSGISYPVELNISGDTRFYDYKEMSRIELDGLLEENISEVANSLGFGDLNISIDSIFPLKSLLGQQANNMRATYRDGESGKSFVNIPIAFYGGGPNLSRVTFRDYDNFDYFSSEAEVDLLDTYLNLADASGFSAVKGLMLKTVITVSGVDPFSFYFVKEGYLYGETPKMADLIANAKGE